MPDERTRSPTMSVEVNSAWRPKFMLQATHQKKIEPNTHTIAFCVHTANKTENAKKIEKCSSNSGTHSK